MNDIEDIFKYKFKTKDLDNIIKKQEKGIACMIPVEMEEEVELRKKHLEILAKQTLFGDNNYLDDETIAKLSKRKDMIDSEIEKERHKSHFEEFIDIEISDDNKKKYEELCSSSYVRKIPNHGYHKTDSELYDSEDRREILTRLKRVGNVYYTPEDWRNAMLILIEAFNYSKEHDYPGMPDFMKGNIRLIKQMPKLILNYKSLVNDKELLMKILNGEVKCIDVSEKTNAVKTQRKPDSEVKGIDLNKVGRTISEEEFERESTRMRMGDDNSILRIAYKPVNTIYNRFSQDTLFNSINNKSKMPCEVDNNGYIVTHDFMQPGSGKRIYERMTGTNKRTMSKLSEAIMKANNKRLSNVFSTTALQDVATAISTNNNQSRYNNFSSKSYYNENINDAKVHQQELDLLERMRKFNPGK